MATKPAKKPAKKPSKKTEVDRYITWMQNRKDTNGLCDVGIERLNWWIAHRNVYTTILAGVRTWTNQQIMELGNFLQPSSTYIPSPTKAEKRLVKIDLWIDLWQVAELLNSSLDLLTSTHQKTLGLTNYANTIRTLRNKIEKLNSEVHQAKEAASARTEPVWWSKGKGKIKLAKAVRQGQFDLRPWQCEKFR